MANIGPNSLLPLFPDCHPSDPPGAARGIAGLAARSSKADQGHWVEFRSLPVRSILNRTRSLRRLPFHWSLNPYRGCEFACRYCYARYTHEFMELRQPEDFERRIFLKQNAAWLLRQELRNVRSGEAIAIGTATDPYQPIERRAKITQGLLEVLADFRGQRIGLVTKSTLLTRDIPLFQRIAANNSLTLHLTVTTLDQALARALEPRAPRPDLRLRALRKLRQAGLRAGVLCSPLLPGITDMPSALQNLIGACKAADASFFFAQPLFLQPCSKETYLTFVREHFPALESTYRKRYRDSAFVSRAYAERVGSLVRALCRKHELPFRSEDAMIPGQAGAASLWPEADLRLRPPIQRVMMAS